MYSLSFFFFNDTATTEIYTLSLHDALPIYPPSPWRQSSLHDRHRVGAQQPFHARGGAARPRRSEEHTSELQSQSNLVCRLLLEKKNYDTASARDSSELRSPINSRPRRSPRN